MKTIAFLLLSLSVFAKANNPYRTYLLSKVSRQSQLINPPATYVPVQVSTICRISRYEIPKGNLFCRMEDKLTRVTKVWIKVGVK